MTEVRATYAYTAVTAPTVREWWGVTLEDGVYRFVEIEYDRTWFNEQGSMNDLKNMAIDAARKAQ